MAVPSLAPRLSRKGTKAGWRPGNEARQSQKLGGGLGTRLGSPKSWDEARQSQKLGGGLGMRLGSPESWAEARQSRKLGGG